MTIRDLYLNKFKPLLQQSFIQLKAHQNNFVSCLQLKEQELENKVLRTAFGGRERR
jgi:hypothetical protein